MTGVPVSLLVIEDDPQIQRFLAAALEAHGYKLVAANNGAQGLMAATEHPPDMIVVDLGLPDMSGLEVIRRLREWYNRPILVLSARNREADKVSALDLGADDYVTKPFGIGELLARLRVARRHALAGERDTTAVRMQIGDLSVDFAARRVQRDGKDIHLTPIEYNLLAVLAKHRGKVLTHRQILSEVWGPSHVESVQDLRIYLRALRGKIEPDPARPRYLITEVGVGYRLMDDDTSEAG